MTDTEQRQNDVIDLQSRVAFQEDALQVLSDQLARQSTELEATRTQLRLLNRRMGELMQQVEQTEGMPSQEVPPHY